MKIDHVMEEDTYKGMFYLAHYDGDFPVSPIPHRHTFFEILWFTSGSGLQDIDGSTYPLSINDLFLISEGQVHCIHNSSNVTGYLLCFKDSFWQQAPESIRNYKSSLFNNLLINSYFHLNSVDASEITELFNSMLKEYGKPDYLGKTDLLAAYMKVLLIKIENLKKESIAVTKKTSNDYALFQKALEIVETNFAKIHDVSDYASRVGISPRKLSELCQHYSGKNAKELIDTRIISEAKRLLQFSTVSIKEIAAQLNFSDQYQFSKFFKKHTNAPPLLFRNKFAEIDM
jgi:AraC-like DNA-binding protein/mannose-6-phosphate isomerase-like protein (cupin superfamily)